MDTTNLILSLTEQYSLNNPLLYLSLVREIMAKSSIGTLLQSKDSILQQLSEIEVEIKKESKPYFHRKGQPEEERDSFYKLIELHKQLLACPTEDEHVLLLAGLKKLDEMGYKNDYSEVVKEILLKQLHKIVIQPLAFPFIGRQKEIEDIRRVLSRGTRNSLLIIGKGGVGKTTLARYVIEQVDRTMYQLFPGKNSFFDGVITLQSRSDSLPGFFLDELFSFEADQIKYLLDNSQILATANEGSYRKFVTNHPDLASKIEVLILDEPPEPDVKTILLHCSSNLQTAYANEITFSEELLTELYSLTKQYMPEGNFPAKGIAMIEEVFLFCKAQGITQVTPDQLRVVVSQKTNIPISSLTELDKKDLSSLADRLKEKVKGQDDVIEKVSRVIQRSRLGFGKKNRPIGSFLFVGPSGVGKTELAKALANELFGDSDAMVRLDMSEFGEAHNVQRLIGAPPGYIGFEEGGQLTNPVKAKPYNLILLDEIEKAHPRVFDIFLQVLDDGRLTDGQGKLVDFRNTVIIATSNAGIDDILDLIEEGKNQDEISKEVKEILTDYFRIEFINRFDDITVFSALQPAALMQIAKLQLEKLRFELQKRNISISISDETLERIGQESYDPRYGARGLLRYIQEKIENKLAEMIIGGELQDGETITF